MLSVRRKIHRIGGSLAVIIPPAWIESKHLKACDLLEIQLNDSLTITPIKEKEKA
jgi:antitoxin component of MazEF toxin-antitoxin module